MTQESVITEAVRRAIGVESPPVTHTIELGAIRRFARAIGDPNPLFNDEAAARKTRYGGVIAPPTFLRSLMDDPARARVDVPYTGVLDGGSDWEYFEPVRPGDRVTITSKVVNVYERQGRLGNMVFVITEFRYENHLDVEIAVQRNTLILYDPDQGPGAQAVTARPDP